MKKTCEGCKALSEWNTTTYVCDLKHPIEIIIGDISHVPKEIKPLEKCEKPITHKKLYEIINQTK